MEHTTSDEIEFLRALEQAGKRSQLRAYRKGLEFRSWIGSGMQVDPERIKRELNRILGRESAEEKDESYEDFMLRKSRAWLSGGRLRAISQDRAIHDGDGTERVYRKRRVTKARKPGVGKGNGGEDKGNWQGKGTLDSSLDWSRKPS